MSNTIRELDDLLNLFADNNSNQITAQDLRDFVVTADFWRSNNNNVNITGGTISGISTLEASRISVDGFLNTGVSLSGNSFSTSRVSIRSPISDLTQIAQIEIFSVPSDYMFLIDSMELLTISISEPDSNLRIKIGNSLKDDEYYENSSVNFNSTGDRHIIDVAQNATLSNSTINFTIINPSSSLTHQGVCIIHGTLMKII